MLAQNEILNERYRIIRHLKHGGMGAIYVAEDNIRFGKLVALKEILFDLTKQSDKQQDSFRRAFEREANILIKLEHDAFPQVIDYFVESDEQFLVMELINGDDLSELFDKHRSGFPFEDVLKWTEQLLDALDYLHTLTPPIIHRDIKPQNLKLTSRGKIKLLDFGIAKSSNPLFQTSIVTKTFTAATLPYSPLEQVIKALDPNHFEFLEQEFGNRLSKIIFAKTDARSDLYSLGATLYHLLTARLPIDALRRTLKIWAGNPDPLQPAHQINSQIPKGISDWLSKAMQIERENRFDSAFAMEKALSQVLVDIKRDEEEIKQRVWLEEQEKLKREREIIEKERREIIAESLLHQKQVKEESMWLAAYEKQQEYSRSKNLGKDEINPLITSQSFDNKQSAADTDTEIKLLLEELKSTDLASQITEDSYLPDNFATIEEKKLPVKPVREEKSFVQPKSKRLRARILSIPAIILLMLVGTGLGIFLLSSKKTKIATNNDSAQLTTIPETSPTPVPTVDNAIQLNTNKTPSNINILPINSNAISNLSNSKTSPSISNQRLVTNPTPQISHFTKQKPTPKVSKKTISKPKKTLDSGAYT